MEYSTGTFNAFVLLGFFAWECVFHLGVVRCVQLLNELLQENNSLGPGRHIIGPGTKVVRIVKGGMIVKNSKKEPLDLEPEQAPEPEPEPEHQEIVEETIVPTEVETVNIKQEIIEASPLHELAEISMQHAQNLFKCEMCSEVFSDRAQLLVHVPIHIWS